jgi:hypothetical protein
MQSVLGLFFILASAGAIAQQYGTASTSPGAASLPDAPSYTTQQTSTDTSTSPSDRTRYVTTSPASAGWLTSATSPPSNFHLNLAAPNSALTSSLVFAGGKLAGTDVADQYQQLGGSVTDSGKNCSHGSVDRDKGSGWTDSLLSIASRSGGYCTLGEGGFWKRGTYAAGRALAAHSGDGFSSFNTSDAHGLGSAQGLPAGYYPFQNYTGERLAARYASQVGRDVLRNMFREFWPDISSHILQRHP